MDNIELIINAKLGSKSSLDKFLKNMQTYIYKILKTYKINDNDVSDLVQTVLIKISKNISKLNDELAYKSWIKQITLNTYYDYLRKKKNKTSKIDLMEFKEDNGYNIPDYTTNPQNSLLNNELDFLIKTSINKLPIHYRIPLTLREVRGLSYNEIQNLTNISLGTIKSRISRAKKLLKNKLDFYHKN